MKVLLDLVDRAHFLTRPAARGTEHQRDENYCSTKMLQSRYKSIRLMHRYLFQTNEKQEVTACPRSPTVILGYWIPVQYRYYTVSMEQL